MERQRLENNSSLLPLICLFFRVPRLIHQSLGAPAHRSRPLPAPSAPASAPLPPFAPAFTFIYLGLFHLGGNNPLTASFIRTTSANPPLAVGQILPARADRLHYGRTNPAGLKRAKGSRLLLKQAPGEGGRRGEDGGGVTPGLRTRGEKTAGS